MSVYCMDALENEVAAKKPKERQLVVRLPGELAARLDDYAERLRDEQPGPNWTVSDVVRMLLARALDDAEGKRGKR